MTGLWSLFVGPTGRADVDVGVSEVEAWVDIAEDLTVGLDDLLELNLNKVVERIDMLFNEPFDLEKSWQKIPFILIPSMHAGTKNEILTLAVSMGSVKDFP